MPRSIALLVLLALAACARGNSAADFTLQNAAGGTWSLAGQRKAVLLTFGYTHCVDTCPVTLAKLSQAVKALGPRAHDVAVVFVTVDPQRDTPPALRAYLDRFDPSFIGLTGTAQQIAAVEQAYHVWAQRIPGKKGNDNYDDAHSSAIFFIDAGSSVAAIHDDADSVGDLTRAVAELAG